MTRFIIILQAAASLLCGLGLLAQQVHAECTASIPTTRPDTRYEAVAGATPTGSEVKDKVTGLIWQRCAFGMSWNGTACTGTAQTKNWLQALDAARTATATTATPQTAWRLPNFNELYTLPERACMNPAINATWFPNTPTSWYWSSTPVFNAANANNAWVVFFDNGNDLWGAKNDSSYLRLVRSGK